MLLYVYASFCINRQEHAMGPLVVLAYSGGLDTSAIVPWLREKYAARVLCFAADVGQGPGELAGLVEKAKRSGALDCVVRDLREEFVRDFVFPTLRAGAVYARTYLLGTAMARPVMAAHHVALAQQAGAQALAHGCTGKGNDQVRFELTYAALAPEPEVIPPESEWQFKRRRPGGRRGGPPGRDEVARCLRDAGRHAAACGAPRARAAGARPAHAAAQGRARAPLRRPGVRRSLVDAGAGGPRRRGREHAEAGDRRGAPEALQGRPHRRGAAQPLRAVPTLVRHLRQGQRLRSEGCRGVHPSLRPLDPDRFRH